MVDYDSEKWKGIVLFHMEPVISLKSDYLMYLINIQYIHASIVEPLVYTIPVRTNMSVISVVISPISIE